MAIRLPQATRNAAVDAITALINAGGAGSIEVRSGAQPASAGDVATGTLLATFTLAVDAFGDGAAGTSALSGTPITTTGAAAGEAGWFRAKSGAASTVFDGSVSAVAGGGDLELNTTTVSVGVDLEITAGSITMPAG